MRFWDMDIDQGRDELKARPGLRIGETRRPLLDAAAAVHQQRDDRSDQEHHEQYLCDACGAGGDPAEAENSGNEGNDEKYDGIMQHEKIPLFGSVGRRPAATCLPFEGEFSGSRIRQKRGAAAEKR
jgi:hypothetical protein